MEKKWYQKTQIRAAIIIAVGAVIAALIGTNKPPPRVEVQYLEYNEPSNVERSVVPEKTQEKTESEQNTARRRVEVQYSEYNEPSNVERSVVPEKTQEKTESEQNTARRQDPLTELLPNTHKTIPIIEANPPKVEANPEYVLEEGKSMFVSSISTWLSATFQNLESVEFVTLVIAPRGQRALRQAVMEAGATVEFETDSGTYYAQVLSIDWNRKRATVRITN